MYTPVGNEFGLIDSLIVALISIIIVFLVLTVIICVASVFSKIIVTIKKAVGI